MYFMSGLLEGMSLDGYGCYPQTKQGNTGLFFLRELH